MLKLSKHHNVKVANDSENVLIPIEAELIIVANDEQPEHDEDKDAGSKEVDKTNNDDDAEPVVESSKSPDPRQEAATPHANAAKDLFNKRRELMDQVNMLNDQLAKHREVLRALDPKAKHEAYADDKELRSYLKPEKMEEKKKSKKIDRKAQVEVVEGLLKVAGILDSFGDENGLGVLEDVLRIFAAKEYERPMYDVQTIEKVKREYPEVQSPAPALSTRHCPDHNSQMLKRVAEGSYQCELDGKIYCWSQGFKDYLGNAHPGAKIQSIDFPDVSTRIFENRSMALSKRQK